MEVFNIPSQYINELNTNRGLKGRKKSRAFMEYCVDTHNGCYYTSRFYADSWEVSGATSWKWMNEFETVLHKYMESHLL